MTAAVTLASERPTGVGTRAAREARLASLLRTDLSHVPPLAAASDAELDQWISRLERYRQACGCKTGGALAIAALVLWPAVGLRRGSPPSIPGALVRWTAAGASGAVTGKAGGLAAAALARRVESRRVARLVTRRP